MSASIAELTFDTGAIDSQVEVLKSEKIALSVISAMNFTRDRGIHGRAGDPDRTGVRLASIGVRFQRLVRDPRKIERAKRTPTSSARRSRTSGRISRCAASPAPMCWLWITPLLIAARRRRSRTLLRRPISPINSTPNLTRRGAPPAGCRSRISDLKEESLASDFAIQKFKADNGIVVTGGDRPGLMSDQQLTELNEQMVLARADTAKSEARYEQIQDLLKSGRAGATRSRFSRQSGRHRSAEKNT